MDYFVYQTEFVSKNSMKCLKSLEAHNFFTSGFVSRPRMKELDSDFVLVLGQVRHSQALSLAPLKSWLLVKKAGEIVTGHCSCMAGRGEACSHLAAIVFLLEYAAKVNADVVVTDQLSAWLPPAMSAKVPKRTLASMDFSSPAERIQKMQRLQPDESPDASSPQRITDVFQGKSKDAVKEFFSTLSSVDPKLVVLSTLQGEMSDLKIL